MATSSANSSPASVKVLGPVSAAATPMTSEATTITAATASTRMACLWAERVKAEATRSAMAITKSPVAALSESDLQYPRCGEKLAHTSTFYPGSDQTGDRASQARTRSVAPDDALSPGVDGGLGTVCEMQLGENVRDVALDRLLAHVEAARDLRVVQPFGDQLQHLELPVGEVVEDVRFCAPGAV